MEEKNKNEELKQQETNEASPVVRASYSTGTDMEPNDCMSQDFFNSLNDRGAISGTIYVCGWGCCNYDHCSCISSGCGSGSGSGYGSGDSHSCECSCYYCGAFGSGFGSGSGSGCGCSDSKSPIELMDKSKFIPWNNTNCLELCESVLLKYGITYPGDSSHVFRLAYTVNGESYN